MVDILYMSTPFQLADYVSVKSSLGTSNTEYILNTFKKRETKANWSTNGVNAHTWKPRDYHLLISIMYVVIVGRNRGKHHYTEPPYTVSTWESVGQHNLQTIEHKQRRTWIFVNIFVIHLISTNQSAMLIIANFCTFATWFALTVGMLASTLCIKWLQIHKEKV